MNERRVVITGMGTINPLGNDVATFWQQAKKGSSGARLVTRFDPSAFKTQFACSIADFQPLERLTPKEVKRSDLFTQYALYAAAEAVADSGLEHPTDPWNYGVVWGVGQGGMATFETEVKRYTQEGFQPRFNPFLIPKMISNIAAGMIAMKLGWQGLNYTTTSACASSNTALMNAFHYIKWGKADAIVTGGSEAPITEASMGGFGSLKSLSTQNDAPQTACKPFDVHRDGFVMGEGAGALVLESYEHAKARGAFIYAEVVGATMTADAYHLTATHPEGLGAAQAMRLALQEAGLQPHDVDYINVHATSTPVGDLSEVQALKAVFGDNLPKLSATKSMTGHLLGAAGSVEAILCVKALEEGLLPPTINTQVLDAAIPSNFPIVLGQAEAVPIQVAMSNTFGFGGHNAIVIFRKVT